MHFIARRNGDTERPGGETGPGRFLFCRCAAGVITSCLRCAQCLSKIAWIHYLREYASSRKICDLPGLHGGNYLRGSRRRPVLVGSQQREKPEALPCEGASKVVDATCPGANHSNRIGSPSFSFVSENS